jgi:hypothetical protein
MNEMNEVSAMDEVSARVYKYRCVRPIDRYRATVGTSVAVVLELGRVVVGLG